jgi:hypothetical protein
VQQMAGFKWAKQRSSKPVHQAMPDRSTQKLRSNAMSAQASPLPVGLGPVSGLRILLRPFLGRGDGLGLVFLPCLGDIVRKRIVWVRRAEEGLDGEEDGTDLEGRRPVALFVSHVGRSQQRQTHS